MTGRRASIRQRRHAHAARGARGFTLVEMLVALVILGFVMSLVSEVVFQVAQIVRAADANSRSLNNRWSQGWSATGLFSNLVDPGLPPEQRPLTGRADSVSGYTTLPLMQQGSGVRPFTLQLRTGADSPDTTELVSMPGFGAAARSPQVVATFPARAEFAYVDGQTRTWDQWPPLTQVDTAAEGLPRVVVVRAADTRAILMWYPYPGETRRVSTARPLFDPHPR